VGRARFTPSGPPQSNGPLVFRGRISLASVNRFALAAALTFALAFAAPAGAITFGTADGNGHPNVGGLVAEQAYSDGTWTYCSGTLISPTVFLTAAHCEEANRV